MRCSACHHPGMHIQVLALGSRLRRCVRCEECEAEQRAEHEGTEREPARATR
jgi:hypothetical protein